MRDALTVALYEPVTLHEDSYTVRYGRFGGVVKGHVRFDNGLETVLVPMGVGFPNVTDRNGFVLGSDTREAVE